MRNSNTRGVISRPRRALGAAAVAGVAGLTLGAGLAHAATAAEVDAGRPWPRRPPTRSKCRASRSTASASTDVQSGKYTAPLVDTPRSITVIPQQDHRADRRHLADRHPAHLAGHHLRRRRRRPAAGRPSVHPRPGLGQQHLRRRHSRRGGQTREVFNLEQVEVVKGPDSAYSGRGSGGGSINLGSKSPRPTTSPCAARSGVGTDEYVRATADANYAFNDNVAVRLNLLGTQGDTPGRKASTSSRWGVAPSLAFGLNGTDTKVTASYYHLDTDQDPDYGIPLSSKTHLGVARTDASADILDVDPRQLLRHRLARLQKTKADIATLAFDHQINDDFSVRQVVRYSKTVNDYIVTNPGDGGAAQFVRRMVDEARHQDPLEPDHHDRGGHRFHGKFDVGAIKNSFDSASS
jgi:catecholate siderophore receptor